MMGYYVDQEKVTLLIFALLKIKKIKIAQISLKTVKPFNDRNKILLLRLAFVDTHVYYSPMICAVHKNILMTGQIFEMIQ